jgi:hypothetical protein
LAAEDMLREFNFPATATPVVIGRGGRFLSNAWIADLSHLARIEANIHVPVAFPFVKRTS